MHKVKTFITWSTVTFVTTLAMLFVTDAVASATELPGINTNCKGEVIASVFVDENDGPVQVADDSGNAKTFNTKGSHTAVFQHGNNEHVVVTTTRLNDGKTERLSITTPPPCVEETVPTTAPPVVEEQPPVSILTQKGVATTVKPVVHQLPETGRPALPMVALGFAAVIGGIGLVVFARRFATSS